MPNPLRAHVKHCSHPACVATRVLEQNGARLVLGKGRHCELAVLAAAGANGLSSAALVAGRRAYAHHLGVTLDGISTGAVADADHAIHARHAAEGNLVGLPNAVHPIPLGTARVKRTSTFQSPSSDHYVLYWP
jgi:hypothetical protein